jgi:hypothetical protein
MRARHPPTSSSQILFFENRVFKINWTQVTTECQASQLFKIESFGRCQAEQLWQPTFTTLCLVQHGHRSHPTHCHSPATRRSRETQGLRYGNRPIKKLFPQEVLKKISQSVGPFGQSVNGEMV